jgi:hypothetical protein
MGLICEFVLSEGVSSGCNKETEGQMVPALAFGLMFL